MRSINFLLTYLLIKLPSGKPAFSSLTLLVGRQKSIQPVKTPAKLGAGVVICLE